MGAGLKVKILRGARELQPRAGSNCTQYSPSGPPSRRGFGGAGADCGLSGTPGAIARSAHSHRLFATLFLGATPNLIVALCGVMATARRRVPPVVWFSVGGRRPRGPQPGGGVRFLERLGYDHDFEAASVTGVLIALGFANRIAAPLAA